MVLYYAFLAASATVSFRIGRSQKATPASTEPDHPKGAKGAVNKVWKLYAKVWDIKMASDPHGATMLGDYRFNDKLADLSLKAHRKYLAALRKCLAQARGIDAGTIEAEGEKQNLFYLIEMLTLEMRASETFGMYEIPTMHLMGPHIYIMQSCQLHPWRTKADCASFVRRVGGYKKQCQQMIAAFKAGIKARRTLPIQSVDAIASMCAANGAGPVEDHIVYKQAAGQFEKLGGSSKALRKAVANVIEGYRILGAFLRDEYRPHARASAGVWSFEGGADVYKGAIEYFTSLMDVGAVELHAMGKAKVAEIGAKIKKVQAQLGPEYAALKLTDFVDAVSKRPGAMATDGEMILSKYRATLDIAKAKLPEFFETLPEAALEVRAIEPFREASAPPAHYYPAPADRSRPAVFYANISKPETRPAYAMDAIALHEGVPGHHLQLSVAQELQGMPRLRKNVQGFTIGYAEGWGLYSEYLGEVMGFYTDPLDYFGRLMAEGAPLDLA
mmetsp:Transcript_44656/g.142183  ORF Transcript_44656/g.142183 Transcript_44656/m.142183 type:complete len:500 (+) Transcript_44656:149-1648(+)